MKKNLYTSYPEGYEKLRKDIVPWYFKPVRKMLMRLLVTILTDS